MSNNVRNVTKQLLGAEDVAFGRGIVQQNRGGTLVPVHKLDLDLPVVDEAELAVTNPTVYPKASIGSRLFVAVNGQYQELSNIVPVIYRVGGALSVEYPYCENGDVIAKWTGVFPKTLTSEDADFSPVGWQIYTVGSSRTIVSETQPPISYGRQGFNWYNPAVPAMYIYYTDGDSGQWIEEASQGVDGALRSDLGAVDSTVPVAGVQAKAFRAMDGIKSLVPVAVAVMNVTGFYAGSSVGGGDFVYSPSMPNTEHNGGTIIAAGALAAWDGTQAGLSGFLNWSGAGFGCYVRTNYDRVKITYFGALPSQLGGNNNQQIPVNKAINSFAGTFNELHAPSGIYYVSDKISMKPAVTLEGDGAEATWFTRANGVTSDSVISAEFTGSGADYIYIRKMTVNGNRQNGGVGKGVVFDNVHVPSYLDDVTVLWCSQANIDIKKSTVIQLNRVWSNGGNTLALDVDSVRSLHIIGGAYEHSESGTAHIRIRNTHNYYYPQATITGGHIEGLLVAGMSGIEVGGGSEYYSVQGLAIAGLQTLGKRVGGESNNYAIKILDDNCQITVMGESHTGLTSFVTGAKAGWPVPPVSAFSISNWHYIGNPSSGYNMPAAELTDKEGDLFKVISQQIVTVPAFSQTEQGIVIPTQPGTDYDVFVQVGGFMGNNLSYFVPEADKTNGIFKIKFVNLTTGAAAQLQNATSFKVLVTSR